MLPLVQRATMFGGVCPAAPKATKSLCRYLAQRFAEMIPRHIVIGFKTAFRMLR